MVLHTTLEEKQECWQPENRLRVAHKCDIFQVKAKVPPRSSQVYPASSHKRWIAQRL